MMEVVFLKLKPVDHSHMSHLGIGLRLRSLGPRPTDPYSAGMESGPEPEEMIHFTGIWDQLWETDSPGSSQTTLRFMLVLASPQKDTHASRYLPACVPLSWSAQAAGTRHPVSLDSRLPAPPFVVS